MQVGENSECHYFAQHIKELQEDYKMDRGNQLAIYCPRVGKSVITKWTGETNWPSTVLESVSLSDDYKMDRGNQLAIYCPRVGKSL